MDIRINPKVHLHLLLTLALALSLSPSPPSFLTNATICTDTTCHFDLEIRQRRSMTYTTSDGVTFNVAWNATERRLQIVENDFHKKVDHDVIGSFVDADDVITTDGYAKTVYVINGEFPGPTLEVMEGATVKVKVTNHLATEGVTVHFHGVHFRDNVWMDGAGYVTQCPILPGHSFEYSFMADPAGSFFYHGHFRNPRIDGIFGAFIVHRRAPLRPYHVITVQDWFWRDAGTLRVMNPYDPILRGTGEASLYVLDRDYSVDGNELSAMAYQSTLLGGRGRSNDDALPLATYDVTSGTRFRFHVLHPGAEFTYEIMVDGHMLDIVALDGHDIVAMSVDSFIINPGERVEFEIEANQPIDLYWIRAELIRHGVGLPPAEDGNIKGANAILRYVTDANSNTSYIDPTSSRRNCTADNPCTVFNCPFLGYASHQYKNCLTLNDAESAFTVDYLVDQYGVNDLEIDEYFLNWGYHIGSSVNARKFAHPSAPFSIDNSDHVIQCDDAVCESGCFCTNILEIPMNRTVQLVMSNLQEGPYLGHHAIHLHGYSFAVMQNGFPDYNATTGLWSRMNDDVICDSSLCAHPSWNGQRPLYNAKPVVKDTVNVPSRGYTVIRFKSTNPGYWMLHCHQESHAEEGMGMLLRVGPAGSHPPVPTGFPTCGNFQLQEEEEVTDVDSMESEETDSSNDLGRYLIHTHESKSSESDKIELTKAELIGASVAFIVIGALLAVIPVLIFVCASARKQR